MTRSILAILILAGLAAAKDNPVVAPNPQLLQVHTVYLLPMGGALDQYLANRLTEAGTFQVVADPQKADAIFSDKIGEGLEQKLNDLYPPPGAKKAEDDKDSQDKPMQRFGSFSRGRGTLFIVDRKTRAVVWSTYFPATDLRPTPTDKRAGEIVKKLQHDMTGK